MRECSASSRVPNSVAAGHHYKLAPSRIQTSSRSAFTARHFSRQPSSLRRQNETTQLATTANIGFVSSAPKRTELEPLDMEADASSNAEHDSTIHAATQSHSTAEHADVRSCSINSTVRAEAITPPQTAPGSHRANGEHTPIAPNAHRNSEITQTRGAHTKIYKAPCVSRETYRAASDNPP